MLILLFLDRIVQSLCRLVLPMPPHKFSMCDSLRNRISGSHDRDLFGTSLDADFHRLMFALPVLANLYSDYLGECMSNISSVFHRLYWLSWLRSLQIFGF